MSDSIWANKKRSSARGGIIHSIMSLFGTKNGVNPMKRYPNEYAERYYVNRKLADGIDVVAKIEIYSKKMVAEHIIELGLQEYMQNKIRKYRQSPENVADAEYNASRARFLSVIKKLTKMTGKKLEELF